MPYEFTATGLEMQEAVRNFMEFAIYPNEETYFEQEEELGPSGYPPIMDKLKALAFDRGGFLGDAPRLEVEGLFGVDRRACRPVGASDVVGLDL